MIDKHSILPADEVGFAYDETTLVLTPSGEALRPGMVLVATGVIPVPQMDDDHVLCKRACEVVDIDESAQFCVSLDTDADADERMTLPGYRSVQVAPLKPAETILVRTGASVREGTLLARTTRSGSGMYRVLDGSDLGVNDVLYVAAEDGEQIAPGTVEVRAHRVSRQLGSLVARVVAGQAAPEQADPAQADPAPEAAPRPPLPHDARQPVVKVLMLAAEAERTKPGMSIVWRGDVRFYDGHMWHVYERENEYNEDQEHKLVATGAPPTPAPEGYLRVVTALGTLPPKRMDSLPKDEDEDEDESTQMVSRTSTDGVKLLEQAATPEPPPNLVQTEAADALVAAMHEADPRRTSAMESARRLLANKDINVRVLARLAAGLAEQGDAPSVAYELARSEAPWRRAAAAFLLPVDHLPFLKADPDEHVQRAALLASNPDKFRARQRGGRAGVVAAIKTVILQAASVDDSSAIDTLASLWSTHPEPPERIDEALRALDLAEQDGTLPLDGPPLSGLGEEDVASADETLSSLWETDTQSTGSFDGVRVNKAGCSHVETDPDRLAALAEGVRADAAIIEDLLKEEYPLTDDQPTELDPLARLKREARVGKGSVAADKFVRRHGHPVKPPTTDDFVNEVLGRAHTRAIQQQQCPVCGEALRRRVDPRQSGVGCAADEQWVNYRCSKVPSHFVVDRPEPTPRRAVKDREGLPQHGSVFEELGWPSTETVVVRPAAPPFPRNTLLVRYDWHQEGSVVLPVCREAVGEELPPENLSDLWVTTGSYANTATRRGYVRAVNIAARPDGEPSILDAIDRSAIRDNLGWAEQLTALGVRVVMNLSLLDDPSRWSPEDVEQRKRIMWQVSQVMRSVVIGEPVGVALGYLAGLHASWAGMTGDLAVVPEDARVEPGLLLRRTGWRQVGGVLAAPDCAVVMAGDFFGEGPETVEDRDLLVATGETVTAEVAGETLRLARVHRDGDLGPDRIEAALRGAVYPLERVSKLEDMGVVVRFSAEQPPPAPVVTAQEERAMDAVFGEGTPETRTIQPARGLGTMREEIAPLPGLEVQARSDLAAARRAERVRPIGFGRESLVGWSASEDQGMSIPNPELLRRVDPDDTVQDAPESVQGESYIYDFGNDPVIRANRQAIGDLARRATRAARLCRGVEASEDDIHKLALELMSDPAELAATEGRLTSPAQTEAEDAHTFALIDEAVEDVTASGLFKDSPEPEESDEEPGKAGQEMSDAAALIAGTNGATS